MAGNMLCIHVGCFPPKWAEMLNVSLEDHHESAVHACDGCFHPHEHMCSCCTASFRCMYIEAFMHSTYAHSNVRMQEQHKLCLHSSLFIVQTSCAKHKKMICCHAPTCPLVSTAQCQVSIHPGHLTPVLRLMRNNQPQS